MAMSTILHVAKREQWEKAKARGSYQADTLKSQGFIHCSKPDQVVRVANFLFRGQTDLVLLCLDSRKVSAEIRDENLEGGDRLFPHIYGPLTMEAVTEVLDFQPQANGTFVLPKALRDVAEE